MTKFQAVIFDMDGVLIDAREWHFEALNFALKPFGYEISKKDHKDRFNGMSTGDKLKILSAERQLPERLHSVISEIKQDKTLRIAAANCYPIVQHQILLSRLKLCGIRIGLVTNSIRTTTEFMTQYAGIRKYFDVVVTNEDVKNTKPNPEGYLLACKSLEVKPETSLVVEDGIYGVQAARKAGCRVLKIDNPSDLSLELMLQHFPELIGEVS